MLNMLAGNKRGSSPRGNFEGKVAIFDIEVTDFSAGGYKGYLICTSIAPVGSDDVYTFELKFGDRSVDKRLLKEVIDALGEYDVLAGHYIRGFDLPWLASRLAFHGMQMPRTWSYLDTYYMARSIQLRSERKSLAFLCDYFHIKPHKTSIYPVEWSDIRSPFKDEFEKAKTEIVEHCQYDVIDNRALLSPLYDLVMQHHKNPWNITTW